MTDDGRRRLAPEVVDELHERFATDLRAFLIGLLRNQELAEEALQNTFRQALRAGGDVDPTKWKAWLFQVAYHEAMGIRRRRQIDIKALREIALSAPRHGLPAHESLIQAEQIERLQAAIGRLPPDQQTVVLKRITNEQTFQQIADELAVPLGTVLTRMRLAIAKLHAALQEPDG